MHTHIIAAPSIHARTPAPSGERFPRSKLWNACWLAGLTATSLAVQATPLTLATVPAGSGGREPAPNVIVSVDDSGSMGWDINGCVTSDFKRVSGWYSSWFNQTDPAPDPGCPTASAANAAANLNKSRMFSLKAALKAQFEDTTRTPDNRIRLAWQSMWGHTPTTQGSITNQLTAGATNSMKPLAGTHRSNFVNWVNNLTPYNGTPSHKLMSDAFNYMRSKEDIDSPWADTPGTAQATPYLACRRTYHILMTDGAWNNTSGTTAAGDADGTNRTLPDGIAYDTTSNQVQAYKSAYGGTTGNLSDHAFKAWATDLQDGSLSSDGLTNTQAMANSVKPLPVTRHTGPETVGATTLQEYWNPKNDPATWQHIVTHTIGFGKAATKWTGDPAWSATDDTYGGDYSALVNGTKSWQDQDTEGERSSELWHAALNGRGKFYPARDASALSAAFASILDNIIADTDTPLVSISASSSSLRTDSNVYIAEYAGATWAGNIKSYTVAAGTGEIGTTPVWYAAGKDLSGVSQGLDATAFDPSLRLVLSHDGTAGISWEWANMSSAQQPLLITGSETDGTDRVNYVRGDRTKEVGAATPGPFRTRASRLGDIVNSNIWFVGKPSGGYSDASYATFRTANVGRAPMIYVGANDGMLHGFGASDGVEKLAYVPKGVLSKFVSFSSPSYTHKYIVDGQPFAGDADLGGATGWKTLLVSGLGGGGKGYFILDVTKPADFLPVNAAAIVKADTTDSTDADIGHIYSPAVVDDGRADKSGQIVKMNDGKWAVVMGNGYNSTNEKPVLIVHYVDGTTALKIAPTCASSCPGFVGSGNGLSAPRLLDLNSDGKVDVAYAGDLQGNLWKFDLASATSTNWKVAFAPVLGSSVPYFVAKSATNVRLPIVSAPYAMLHPKGGIMLAFGTGRNVTDTDPTNTGTTTTYPTTGNIDTMWGVWDNSAINVSATPVTFTDPTLGVINAGTDTSRPTTLVQQTPALAGTEAPVGTETVGKVFYDVSRNGVVYTADATTKRGWYLDWPVVGLRVLHNPVIFKGERILVQSTVPQSGSAVAGETCTPSSLPEKTFVSVFNMFSGNPSQTQVFTPIKTDIPVGNLGIAQINPGDFSRYIGDGNVRLSGPAGSTNLKTGEGLGLRSNWREYQ